MRRREFKEWELQRTGMSWLVSIGFIIKQHGKVTLPDGKILTVNCLDFAASYLLP